MKVQSITNKPQPTFGEKLYRFTKQTYYGRRISGGKGNLDYDVYVDGNGKNIFYKLYTVYKDDKWIKSFLRYFSGNKLYKEIRSYNKYV